MIMTKKNLIREFLNLDGSSVEDDDNSENTSQVNSGTQTTDGYVSQARQRMEYPFNFGGTAYSRGATLQGTELGDYSGSEVNDGKGIDIENVGDGELFNDDVYKALGINTAGDISIDDDDKRGEEEVNIADMNEFEDAENTDIDPEDNFDEEVEEDEGQITDGDIESGEVIPNSDDIPENIMDLIKQTINDKMSNNQDFSQNNPATATDLENNRPFGSKLTSKPSISQQLSGIDNLVHEYYERKKTNK